jgi:rod shape-determining protein MreC
VYPRGIPIGTVLGEEKTPEQWARTYIVRPAVIPADASSVMILMSQRSTGGVDNVWTGIIGDSTARRIAAAADSISNADSVRKAPALSPADSMRRDSLRRVRRARRDSLRRDSIANAQRDSNAPRPDTTPTTPPPR